MTQFGTGFLSIAPASDIGPELKSDRQLLAFPIPSEADVDAPMRDVGDVLKAPSILGLIGSLDFADRSAGRSAALTLIVPFREFRAFHRREKSQPESSPCLSRIFLRAKNFNKNAARRIRGIKDVDAETKWHAPCSSPCSTKKKKSEEMLDGYLTKPRSLLRPCASYFSPPPLHCCRWRPTPPPCH